MSTPRVNLVRVRVDAGLPLCRSVTLLFIRTAQTNELFREVPALNRVRNGCQSTSEMGHWISVRSSSERECKPAVQSSAMAVKGLRRKGGANLSGGQRQRILIARELVHKPAVFILDEATSTLDHHTQRSVMESLSELNTTRMMAAHRLSTIRNAHRIDVIDSSRVVQHGTCRDLSAISGPFFHLIKKQMGC